MGYTTLFCAVDLNRVRAAIADHDHAVIDAAREHDPDEFESALDDDDPTVGTALTQIVDGTSLIKISPELGHQYGYAFKLLCATLGEWLPDEDAIGDLGPLELQSPLETFRSPVDLPLNGCFPYVSYLTADEVQREAKRLESINLSFPDEDIEEGREAYASCIQQAASEKLAVVTFYH